MDKAHHSIKQFMKGLWKHRELLLFVLPGFVLIIMFAYIPMFGVILAFKKYTFAKGVFGSPWCGLENFKFLFGSSGIAWRMLRNTVGYYLLFTIIGTICNVALAIALNECRNKYFAKFSQTIMIMPTFISYIAIAFIVKAILQNNTGMINSILRSVGHSEISFYMQPKYWPVIFTIINVWKGTGYGSILYLSALAGIDQEIFESAMLDGATKWQQIRYITLPMLSSMVAILTLLGLGNIMNSNTGLFYQVTQNIGALYPATQTLDTYVLNALVTNSASYGVTAAVSLFQSVVGCAMVIGVNRIVRRISPEHALF
ncbi:MAG: ABC transporter permease subunit [Acetatifactor sp.]|nr:ABC transporter permease subunit [Acetatifactor sp.]